MTPRRLFFLCILIPLILYWPLRRAGFVYDDVWLIQRNPAVQALNPLSYFTNPQTVAAPESGLASDIYRPLLPFSFAIDFRLWKFWPLPYHVENILLHALNGFLLGLLLRRWLSPVAAAVAVVVFLVHPVQVQSVAWIAQRSTLLSSAGMLLTLLILFRTTSALGLALAVLSYGVALFSKETAVVLPTLLLLILWADRSGKERLEGSRMKGVACLVVLAAGYMMLRANQLSHWSQMPEATRDFKADAATGLLALPVYLGKLLCPYKLRVSYQTPLLTTRALAGAFLVWILYLGACVRWCRRRPRIAAALAWILISLLPVLQIVPIRTFVAERFLYVPLMGFAGLAGSLIERPKWRWVLPVWVLYLVGMSVMQIPNWQSERQLWAATVRADPSNGFAHLCYAQATEDRQEAESHLREALNQRLSPALRLTALVNLSDVLLKENHPQEALGYARKALEGDPNNLAALFNGCLAAWRSGEHQAARQIFERLRATLGVNHGAVQSLAKEMGQNL